MATVSPQGDRPPEPHEEPPTPLIDAALERYEAALLAFEDGKHNSAALLTSVLCRERLATAFVKPGTTPDVVQRLMELDSRLRHAALQIPEADWRAWRRAVNPPSSHWWWRADEAEAEAAERSQFPHMLLAALLMTVTLGLAVEIIRRVWSGGSDLMAVVSTLLTLLLTGGPLTKQGRELTRWLMEKLHLSTRYWGQTVLAASCLAFVAILLLWLTLPAMARTYNNRGISLLQTGELTGAQRALERAVSIDPDYATAYYNLAGAYVDIGDYDQAQALYRQALASDRTLDLAYNGLGYVLTLQGQPEQAISILHTGLSMAQDDPGRVALWSNLGRAYLEDGRYYEAEASLAQALALDPTEAVAHCTMALVAEALQHPKDDRGLLWENCLRYADPTTPRGQEWATTARARLRSLREEP